MFWKGIPFFKNTMENKTYSEKLRDPRWQRKRLEVMQRDNFTCQYCKNDELTLNVHHMKYGKEPWDIDSKYLITLCESCHEIESQYRKETEGLLLESLRINKFTALQIHTLSTIFGQDIDSEWARNENSLTYLSTIIKKTEEWDLEAKKAVNEMFTEFFKNVNASKNDLKF